MPRTIAVACFSRANSAVRPEKLSTSIAQSPVLTVGSTSRIISHRSSTLNIALLSGLLRTATIISSKRGADRRMMSRWPLVKGSKEPGKIARRIGCSYDVITKCNYFVSLSAASCHLPLFSVRISLQINAFTITQSRHEQKRTSRCIL